MDNKDASITIRLTTEHKNRLLAACHSFNSSITSSILFGLDNYLVQNYIKLADRYLELVKALPPGQLRDQAAKAHSDVVEAGKYFNDQARNAIDLSETYKEIESIEAYRDLLAETVNAEA